MRKIRDIIIVLNAKQKKPIIKDTEEDNRLLRTKQLSMFDFGVEE